MRDWFESLQPRERMFVTLGAVAVLAVILYGFAWVPFDKRHQQLADDVASWQRSLSELRPLKQALASQQGSPGGVRPVSSQTPVVIVDQTARSRGLDRALKRSQPTTSTGIRVEFEDVAFDDLVLWLGDLNAQYGLVLQQGSFSVSNAGPGRVNSSLTLERSP